jgi:hypothetical protein
MSAPPNLPRRAGRKVVLLADLGGGVRALIDFGIAISVRRFVSISLPLVMEHRAHRSDSWDGAPTPTGLSAAASPMTPSGCRTPTAPHPGGWRRLPLSSYEQPEETITVPVRAGHRFGDPEQPTEVLAVPGEAFFQSRDALKLARPFLLEQRAGSQRHPIAGVGIPPIRRAALWPTRLPPYHSAVSAPTHCDRRKR